MSDDAELRAFLETVTPAKRRRDAETMLGLMERITGEHPQLFGSIVAFGTYTFRYADGREGESSPAAFAPRKSSLVIYLSDGVGVHASKLARLGPHRPGTVCIYVTDLEALDQEVLAEIVEESYRNLTSGTGMQYVRGI